MPFAPGYRGFLRFCTAVGYDLAPFQKKIARAVLGPSREVGACLPRGSAKSTLAALLAVHHLLSTDRPSVYIGASSRDQARIIGRIIERYARHRRIADLLTVRHDEIRLGDRKGPTALMVVASDGARALGWERPTLMIGDEVLAWSDRDPSLLGAMQTSLLKNPTARLLYISTAPLTPDSPWGTVRARALALPDVARDGAFIEATGRGMTWLEWSLPDGADPSDIAAVKAANPAPWVTADMLAEQHYRVAPFDWLALHCNRAHVSSARWLPDGAWAACHEPYTVDDDEPLVLGIDVGGSRSATALVACVGGEECVRVAFVRVWQGRDAVLKVTAAVEELVATGRRIRECVYDPMRYDAEAQRLERDLGLTATEWPQSESRMTRCSEHLHRLIVERRLLHAADPDLDRHVANAIAKPTSRGWRLVKAAETVQIDALIALAMSAERASQAVYRPKFVGWA